MHDYIPGSDADFDLWVNNFLAALDARKAALGFDGPEFDALAEARDAWTSALAEHTLAHSAAIAATHAKQHARQTLVERLRASAARLQTHPALQDADRAALGITVRQTTRRRAQPPSTSPIAHVDTGQRMRHVINFLSEGRRGKPEGVRGCEIWGCVGEREAVASEMRFLAVRTASPFVVEYRGDEAGRVAHYMLRWVNARGEQGPWSRTVSATITA